LLNFLQRIKVTKKPSGNETLKIRRVLVFCLFSLAGYRKTTRSSSL
jgi:hypothetical protein